MAQVRVQSLADETGGRIIFVVEEHGRGRYLYSKTGDLAVETFTRTGTRFHSTLPQAGSRSSPDYPV